MKYFPILLLCLLMTLSSCISLKRYKAIQKERDALKASLMSVNDNLVKSTQNLNDYSSRIKLFDQEKESLKKEMRLNEDQVLFLRKQLTDCQSLRDKQLSQVSDLTKLSKTANDNIMETLSQLEGKDQYIQKLQNAKTRLDSINLALAVNLTTMLKDGIKDKDIEIKVDKTVVMINLSDNMLFQSGSAAIKSQAKAVLSKISQIIESRPDLEVMVEGYTDDVPIKNSCVEDNWDLSVKRSTAVVRTLQNQYKIEPSRLIAAGRSEYLPLVPNTNAEGRAKNRRTRIIIMPRLDQFYDLLDPNQVPPK